MNEEFMAFLQTLPPEKQAEFMAQMQGGQPQPIEAMPQAPGMAPQQPMPPQVDPNMGMPGKQPLPTSEDTYRDFAGEGDVIADQQAMAEQLRGTENAQGMHTQNAGFVASSPLSALATGASRIKGSMDARDALAAKVKLSEELGARDKLDFESEFRRKEAKKAQAKALRSPSPLETMAVNQNEQMNA